MERRALVIWGTSGHARVVASLVRLLPEWSIAGFLDDVHRDRHGSVFCGSPVLGGREALASLLQRDWRHLFLGFGANRPRLDLARQIGNTSGFSFPTLVHPSAVVADTATLAPGVLVGPGAIINADAHVGLQAIVNSGAIVEHEATVGPGAHIGPAACLAGGVEVGECSWIGAGALIRERLIVGAEATVGMGAVVTRAVESRSVVIGCPARPMQKSSS